MIPRPLTAALALRAALALAGCLEAGRGSASCSSGEISLTRLP